MAKVSVIIPNYNRAPFLDETVQSVLNTRDFERYVADIIIVDDASTDPAVRQVMTDIQSLHPEVVKTIFLHKNSGQAYARNVGIQEASGSIILPLDNDDLISPDYIPLAADFLNENPQTGIVYAHAAFFGAIESDWHLPDFKMPDFLVKNVIFNSAFFRKSDWEKVGGYDVAMRIWEDWNLWIGLIGLGLVSHRLDGTHFYYRQHDQDLSVSQQITETNRLEGYKRLVENNRFLYESHFSEKNTADLAVSLLENRNRLATQFDIA